MDAEEILRGYYGMLRIAKECCKGLGDKEILGMLQTLVVLKTVRFHLYPRLELFTWCAALAS